MSTKTNSPGERMLKMGQVQDIRQLVLLEG
jgi:hypothetical protein